MLFQTTIKNAVSCSGVGLHTGLLSNLTLRPGNPDSGIVFIRKDTPQKTRIKAHIDNVVDATLATTIGNEGVSVSTIEHLMAAFAGLGIDNAEVELDAQEVPIMDGSSEPFHAILKEGGVRLQEKGKKIYCCPAPGDREGRRSGSDPAPGQRFSNYLHHRLPASPDFEPKVWNSDL